MALFIIVIYKSSQCFSVSLQKPITFFINLLKINQMKMKISITTSILSDALKTIEAFSDSGWAVSKGPTLTWSWKKFRVQFKSELVKHLKINQK